MPKITQYISHCSKAIKNSIPLVFCYSSALCTFVSLVRISLTTVCPSLCHPLRSLSDTTGAAALEFSLGSQNHRDRNTTSQA